MAEERFFALDHVGTTRHIEGTDLSALVPHIQKMLVSRGAEFEDATEVLSGRVIYTSVALIPQGQLTIWVKASQFEGVGVLVEAKVFHKTEGGAAADEELSNFMSELDERVADNRPSR